MYFRLTILFFTLLFYTPVASAMDQLRIGILPVVDTLPLLVGDEQGDFEKEGIKLELISFQSALERDAALQADRLDGYFGDIINTILLVGSGRRVKIITTAFHTHSKYRMFGIAVSPNSGIGNISELKGKKVAISRASIIDYVLDVFLTNHRLPVDFVEKQVIKKMPVRVQMLLSDQVSSAVLPEPLLTLAETKGAEVIVDDRNLDTSLTILALTDNVLKQNDIQSRFLKAYASAVEKINKDPNAYKSTMIEKTRIPKPIEDKFDMPMFPVPAVPSEKDITNAINWLSKNEMLNAKVTYSDVVISNNQ